MSRPVVVIDTETGGLDPERHPLWEIATVVYGDGGKRAEHLYRMEPDLSAAEPQALEINRYYERTKTMEHPSHLPGRVFDLAGTDLATGGYWTPPADLAPCLALWLSGVTIVAANPGFDAGFLSAFLRSHGHAPSWHYRLRDIGSLAFGWLHGTANCLPMKVPALDASTDEFAVALGVDPDQFLRHSALGDCLLVAAMLDVITGQVRADG